MARRAKSGTQTDEMDTGGEDEINVGDDAPVTREAPLIASADLDDPEEDEEEDLLDDDEGEMVAEDSPEPEWPEGVTPYTREEYEEAMNVLAKLLDSAKAKPALKNAISIVLQEAVRRMSVEQLMAAVLRWDQAYLPVTQASVAVRRKFAEDLRRANWENGYKG